MSTLTFLALTFALGVIAGLRSLTAPMVVSWAARLGWLDLRGTWAAFLGHTVTTLVLTALTIGELIADQLPQTPSRKSPSGFAARIVMAAFSAAAVSAGVHHATVPGVIAAVLGAVVGTLGGYDARTRLVRAFAVRDSVIAIPEDILAVGGGFLVFFLLRR
jgi:uncharacterized membrane protein